MRILTDFMVHTVGELRAAIANLPDDARLEAYGPDSSGYAFSRGNNVCVLVATDDDGSNGRVCIEHDDCV